MSAMKRMFRAMAPPRSPLTPTHQPIQSLPHAIRASQQAEYARGLKDGVAMTLDHIQGLEAGGVPYYGDVPQSLIDYIERAREQLGKEL